MTPSIFPVFSNFPFTCLSIAPNTASVKGFASGPYEQICTNGLERFRSKDGEKRRKLMDKFIIVN